MFFKKVKLLCQLKCFGVYKVIGVIDDLFLIPQMSWEGN